MSAPPEYRVLGSRVSALTVDALVDLLCAPPPAAPHPVVIGNHNLHSAALQRRSPAMRRFYERAYAVYVDGMPLVWFGRMLGLPLTRANRMTCVDWLDSFLARAARDGRSVFFLAGRAAANARAVGELRARHPALRIDGHHGYFDVAGPENDEVLALLRERRPDVLLVGMGMPRQEAWIDANIERLPAGVVVNVGACLDYVAGDMYTPPRWMARLGFEWLGRLLAEPARLAHRYLVEPWTLVPVALGELWHRRVRRRASDA